MRHKRVGRKLGVTTKHRKAMFRNMATDLLRHDKIKTTDTRAKEIRRVVDKLITLAKKGTLEARRKASGFVRDPEIVKKLFSELAEKYKERPGGYTRIIKLGYRKGDNTPISLIELVQEEYKPKKKKKTKKKSTQAKTSKDQNTKSSSKKESAEDLGLVEKATDTAEPEVKLDSDTVPEEKLSADNTTEIKESPVEDTLAEDTAAKVEKDPVDDEQSETVKADKDPEPEESTEAETLTAKEENKDVDQEVESDSEVKNEEASSDDNSEEAADNKEDKK